MHIEKLSLIRMTSFLVTFSDLNLSSEFFCQMMFVVYTNKTEGNEVRRSSDALLLRPQVVEQRVLCDQPAGDGFLQGPEERRSGHSVSQRDSRQPEGRRVRGGAGLQKEEARL